MNQVSNRFKLRFRVHEKNNIWYCNYKNVDYKFGSTGIILLART